MSSSEVCIIVYVGDIGQSSRQATLRQFREGGLSVLVATDVAARGLDIAGVSSVMYGSKVHNTGCTWKIAFIVAWNTNVFVEMYEESSKLKFLILSYRLIWCFILRHHRRLMTTCTGNRDSNCNDLQLKASYEMFWASRSGRTGRAGRNGTSVLLYTAAEERKLGWLSTCWLNISSSNSLFGTTGLFESALNFKFQRSGPPTPQQISQASAAFAAKKIGQVDSEVVQYFIPFAKHLIKSTDVGLISTPESDEFGLGLNLDLDNAGEVVVRPRKYFQRRCYYSSQWIIHFSNHHRHLWKSCWPAV